MWSYIAVLTLASGAFAQSCGVQSKDPPLGVADETVFPWVGLIYYQKGDKAPENLAMCTLIDKQHVVVPAYVTSPPSSQILKYIQFGATDIENTASALNYTIDKIIKHPEHKKDRSMRTKNDIAIIRLKEPVQLSDKLTPACLPVSGQSYDAEQYYFMSYNLGNPPAHAEAKGRKDISLLRRVKSAECAEAYKGHGAVIGPNDICAGDAVSDSCRGDAGSPLLMKTPAGWTAVGMSHFGPRNCKSGIPTAFLSLQQYADWIRTVIAS